MEPELQHAYPLLGFGQQKYIIHAALYKYLTIGLLYLTPMLPEIKKSFDLF